MPKSSPKDASKKRPKFFIIDGHAHIYRAYFAPFRDLTSPTGEPTKATYVFTQMLFQIAEQQQPDYLCMVIDHGDETVFRREIDPNYKANREPPPDDFKPQEERIIQLVKDAGIPIYVAPGFEADDLIASIVDQNKGEYDFHLVSKDKDLRQLLGDGVVIYDPQKDETFDADAMHAKLGYTPEQATEVQALMGDNIDNVPGVPGIGEKTAAKLINKYGSALAVFEHADELTPKQSERVKEHGSGQIETSMKLVTLLRDVKVDGFDLDACKFEGLEAPTLQNHLEELGFRTLLHKAGGTPAKNAPPQKRVKPKYNPLPPMGGLFDPPADEQPETTD
ncbi:MAG: 5'-3' exonuclease H3TH domain-containing protein, partial [Planctomycetota bacterium]